MTCHLGNSAVLGMVIGNFHEQTRNKEGFYKKKNPGKTTDLSLRELKKLTGHKSPRKKIYMLFYIEIKK